MIFSLQVEKHVLGGLLKNPEIFFEIEPFVSEHDFANEIHHTIFVVLKQSLHRGEKPDKVLLAQQIQNLGIVFKDGLNVFDYLENLVFTQITSSATIQACKELVKLRVRRELTETADKMKMYVKDSGNKSSDEIISEIDAIYHDRVSSYVTNEEPQSIFADMEDRIEERGNAPQEESGLITPFSEFNRLFGGLKDKNVYAFVSRAGCGKSTFLSDIGLHTAILSKNKIRVLYLDTEMEREDMQHRIAASLSGVPMWYIQTGNWRKDPKMVELLRPALKLARNYMMDHIFVGNKDIDQVCSLVRRWYYTQVGRGNQCIIIYDYIKLTGEKVDKNWAEHQAIGQKVDKLKLLCKEISCPMLTAMQLNRTGESYNRKGGDFTDDSSAISLSDRLQWFATFVSILRRKTLDEVAMDGEEFGTHKLIPLKARFQGREAAGHQDFMKRRKEDGSIAYVNNFINFELNNFRVTEKGSLKHIIDSENAKYTLDGKNKNDGGLLEE